MDERPSYADPAGGVVALLSAREPDFEDRTHKNKVIAGSASGVVPLKFAYAGSAAHTHELLASAQSYHDVVGSIPHEVASLVSARLPHTGARQLVEIGPGTGQHSIAFLNKLTTLGFEQDRYLGLDFSRTLLRKAAAAIKTSCASVSAVDSHIWDVEESPTDRIETWRNGDRPVLSLMLGQTLGNVENVSATLDHVWHSLRPGDFLLIGLSAYSKRISPAAYVAPYQTKIFQNAATEPLRACGIDPAAYKFHIGFRDGAVVAEAILTRAVDLDGVTLPAGHTVRCFQSRRFRARDVEDLLRAAGWRIEDSSLDSSGEHLTVVCKRLSITPTGIFAGNV